MLYVCWLNFTPDLLTIMSSNFCLISLENLRFNKQFIVSKQYMQCNLRTLLKSINQAVLTISAENSVSFFQTFFRVSTVRLPQKRLFSQIFYLQASLSLISHLFDLTVTMLGYSFNSIPASEQREILDYFLLFF